MGANADVIRRMTEEAFMKGNVSVIDEVFADDFKSHDAPPGMPPTKEGFKELAGMVASTFSNARFELDEYIDTADGRVVENWIMVGTHSGEAFGMPPSNQEVTVRGIEIWRLEGGKVVEHWASVDMSDFFMKAGPPPA